jgi:radical SAM protein with 4Fe4S-binding SPASM domain
MSVERFRLLLDQLPDLEEVTLQGLGEPLLAPDFFAMVEEAVNRGVRVGFNTNGTVLTRARSERLVGLGVDWLHVSIDGATPETFGAIRRGARLERVLANLRMLVAVKSRLGRSKPRVQLNTVLMRRNLAELPALVELAADVGVDAMWVQQLAHDFQDADGEPQFAPIHAFTEQEALWHDDAVVEVLARASTLADERHLELRLPRGSKAARRIPGPGTPRCDWPFVSSYVNHDGRVQPCCMVMGADRATLGHLDESSFTAIWTGTAYRDLRKGLVGDGPPPAVCRGCSLYHGRF